MRIIRLVSSLSILAVSVVFFGAVWAQEFPTRPLKIIVPSNAGNSPDHVARIIADELARVLAQPVVVENKPSADGIIAYESVAKATPDGYTLGIVTVPALAGLPATVKGLRFDPLKDMPPLAVLVETQYVFGSASQFQWKNFNELIAHAKANPGKLNFGSSGANLRLLVEAILQAQNLNVVHIPYNGGGPYVKAVVAGEVQMGFISASTVTAHGERFRPLATTARIREPARPDIPTFVELGYPQIRGPSFSLNVSSGVPKPIFDKLSVAVRQALRAPIVKERFQKLEFEIVDIPPEAANKLLQDEAAMYSSIAKNAGIVPH